MEYLVTMTTRVPDGTPEQAVYDVRAREAARSRELAAAGHLRRLWRPPPRPKAQANPTPRPGEWRSLGLFAAADGAQLEQVLASMPLRVWRTDEVTPLAPHPNDPALAPGNTGTEFLTAFTISIPEGTPRSRGELAERRVPHPVQGDPALVSHLDRDPAPGPGPSLPDTHPGGLRSGSPPVAFGAEFDVQCAQVLPPGIVQGRELVLAGRIVQSPDG